MQSSYVMLWGATTTSWLLAAASALPNLLALALLVMGLREAQAARVRLLWGRALLCLGVAALSAGAGVAMYAWQGYSAARDDSVVDPAQKARLLAEGISGAMNCFAAGIAFSLLPLLTSLVLLVRVRRLQRRDAAPPA